MKTEKRKSQKKHKRSKKYRGGADDISEDDMRSSSTSSDWGLMDTAEEAAVLAPYKNKILQDKIVYGLGFVAVTGLIGFAVFKKMK